MTGHLAKKGNRWYVVLNETDPVTGKRKKKWISTGLTRKKDAEPLLHRILDEVNRGVYVNPSTMTVKELLERWYKDVAKPNLAESTLKRYKSIIYKHLIPNLGAIKLGELSAPVIQAYYTKELTSGKLSKGKKAKPTGKPLSNTSVIQHHRVLSAAIKQAVKWRLIPYDVTAGVDKPRKERKGVPVWTEEEAAAFLQAASDSRFFALYALALGTGMRRGELFGLKWEDIDWDAGTITIRRTQVSPGKIGVRGEVEPATYKGPKTRSGWRTISISAKLLEVLRRHKIQQNKEKLMYGSDYYDDGLVLCRPNGLAQDPNSIVKGEYRRLIEKAGVPYIRFHDLRHTHVTDLIRKGYHAKDISTRVGHSSIAVTMDIYGHFFPEESGAAHAIDDLLPDFEHKAQR